MRQYLEVFYTTLVILAAMWIGGLMLITLLWLAKQVGL